MEYLTFEAKIEEVEQKIKQLKNMPIENESALNLSAEIARLEEKKRKLFDDIYKNLSAWDIVQISRHPNRPYSLDYINALFTDTEMLHGDRLFSEDAALVTGIGFFRTTPIAFIGHQKGRDINQRMERNFGMPSPEGYRKAQRIMDLAERFSLPLITFVDTPGAYPGIGAEERGQSEAIAQSLMKISHLEVPCLTFVIGEGGSGGALAITSCDHIAMLEFATYSVISPEGCASILWKDASKASTASEALKITAKDLQSHALVDEIITEPLGGAHRDYAAMFAALEVSLEQNLTNLIHLNAAQLISRREKRISKLTSVAEGV